MAHLSSRSLALVTLTPALSLALAACGSPAINTNYTPGAQPTTGATAALPSQSPTSTASKSVSAKASAHGTTGAHTTRSGTSTTSHTTAPSGSHSSSGGGGTHTVGPSNAAITVTPSTNLVTGQTVTIRGSHFNPKIKVIVVQCINKGSSTQANNCDINILALPKGFYPAANGTFTTTLRVKKTFGSNTCSASTPCIVSVTEPTNNPTEEADAPISFR